MRLKHIAVGTVFGRLTVTGVGIPFTTPEGWRSSSSACICVCGSSKTIRNQNLKNGTTRSCGCLHIDAASKVARIHGHNRKGCSTPTYKSWRAIVQRCENPRCKKYPDYGGRGISMCSRWRNSYAFFLEDMGPQPAKHRIERKDNNGNYEPGNCRWATAKEQARNTRATRIVTYDGATCSLPEMCERHSLSYLLVYTRLYRGWTIEEAIETPAQHRKPNASQTPPSSRSSPKSFR